MAETLFVTPNELTSTTILGGNVDPDKYKPCILMVQVGVIEPLLGSELYDKIKSDYESSSLAGDYETLFNEYVKPITKFRALGEYLEVAGFTVGNGGVFRHAPDNAEVADKDDTQFLSNKYDALAQAYIERFYKWICKNPITEYKTYQDEVNARKGMNLTFGWKLGSNPERKWYLEDEL